MGVYVMEAFFEVPIARVFQVVTDLKKYAWRTDLNAIKIDTDELGFTEIAKSGVATHFKILEKKENSCYSFELENQFLSGTWRGEFVDYGLEKCKLVLTEEIYIKKWLMRVFATLTGYIKKMQKKYVLDLRKKINSKPV